MKLHPLYTSHVLFLPLLEHEIRVEVADFWIRSAPRTVVLQFVVPFVSWYITLYNPTICQNFSIVEKTSKLPFVICICDLSKY